MQYVGAGNSIRRSPSHHVRCGIIARVTNTPPLADSSNRPVIAREVQTPVADSYESTKAKFDTEDAAEKYSRKHDNARDRREQRCIADAMAACGLAAKRTAS